MCSWLARPIFLFALAMIVPIEAAEGAERSPPAGKTEQAWVTAIRGKTNLEGIDPALVDAVRRIDEVRGQIGFDSRGKLVGLDLSSGRVSVTDASIDRLRQFKGLKSLVIGQTGISDEGVARLRAALPQCKITREQ